MRQPALIAAGLAPDRYKLHSARHYAVSACSATAASIPQVAEHIGDHVDTVTGRDQEMLVRIAIDFP